MYYKLCNKTDVECLGIKIGELEFKENNEEYIMLKSVLNIIKENMNILCEYYNEERNTDGSLGGYILFFNSNNDDVLLKKIFESYGIKEELFEYEEVITSNNEIIWKSYCYIVSDDYGIIIIKPVAKKQGLKYLLRI